MICRIWFPCPNCEGKGWEKNISLVKIYDKPEKLPESIASKSSIFAGIPVFGETGPKKCDQCGGTGKI